MWAQVLIEWRWPLAVIVVAVLAFLVYRDLFRRVDETVSHVAGTAIETAGEVARGLLSGNVTESFVSALPELASDGGGRLELATLMVTETFTRSDERRILWDAVSLGKTVSEIKVPVTYRYFLRLDDAWRVEIDGPICRVWAPAIRPTLPPAIDTARMEKRVDADWLRFDASEQLEALQKTITPRLRTYAADQRRLVLVRDEARRTVREFVKTWLLREDQWGDSGVRMIDVVFADEAPEVGTPASSDSG